MHDSQVVVLTDDGTQSSKMKTWKSRLKARRRCWLDRCFPPSQARIIDPRFEVNGARVARCRFI